MNGYLYILNLFRKSKSSAGFTLIELMVAMLLTSIVISAAGFGLVTVATANNKAQAETERRVNLNRALDFIADEIRMSNSVNTGSSLTISGATGVLRLTIPSDSTNSNRVYYIGSPSDSNWVGPYAVFRAAGTYTTTATVSGGSMLVNGITAPAEAPTCSGTLVGANGFYACILNSSMVDLYLYGKLTDGYNNQTGTYKVTTRVFARNR